MRRYAIELDFDEMDMIRGLLAEYHADLSHILAICERDGVMPGDESFLGDLALAERLCERFGRL